MADSAGGTLTQESERLGQKSLIKVDGVDYTSETNTVTGAIPGVSLTLKGLTDSVQVDVGAPGPDQSALADKVKAFTNAYNTVVDSIRAKLTEKPVANADDRRPRRRPAPCTATPALNTILRQLRQAVSDPIAGNAVALDEMAELGVSTGAASSAINADSVAGKLTFDAAKLTAALDADPLAVRKLLGGITGTNGFAQRIRGHPRPGLGHERRPSQRISSEDTDALEHRERPHPVRQAHDGEAGRAQQAVPAMETALQKAQSRASDISGLSTSS